MTAWLRFKIMWLSGIMRQQKGKFVSFKNASRAYWFSYQLLDVKHMFSVTYFYRENPWSQHRLLVFNKQQGIFYIHFFTVYIGSMLYILQRINKVPQQKYNRNIISLKENQIWWSVREFLCRYESHRSRWRCDLRQLAPPGERASH